MNALYFGEVMHARLRPVHHKFAYRVFSMYIDLDDLDRVSSRSRLFSYNRPNLLSFYDRDHGPRDGTPLKPWIENQLTAAGIEYSRGRVRVVSFPRMLGYVFNPLSVYFCFDDTERLRAIVYEVKNTFGEQHAYTFAIDDEGDRPIRHECKKRFYVSPFIGMDATYRFRVEAPDERLALLIREHESGAETLVATLTGRRQPLSDVSMVRALLRHPAMTLKVIIAIHWQALRLWRKGVRIFPRSRVRTSPTS